MRLFALSILTLLLAGSVLAADPKIENLTALSVGGHVTVRFDLASAFDKRRVDQIGSGAQTLITYVVEIYRDRPNWFDEGISRARIEVSAQFNSVTREYLLTYRRDRKLVKSQTFTDLASLEKAMTVIDEPNLFDIGSRRPYKMKVRAKADLMRGWLLYFIPWEISTHWKETRVTSAEAKP
ncbi:MAG TPA: DUF4390 domain-containing protein [Thermoanaerobaculia bacterium]|nr:DUF4390 domain-containing protein [Thermoanaerobaculia bacterium]